jgi:hypothetical protein
LAYHIIYKKEKRNWCQFTLGDYINGLNEWHERFLDAFEEGKYQAKKRRFLELQTKGMNSPKMLRRGRKKHPYPTKNIYRMDNPTDVAEVKRFPWFCVCWNQDRKKAPDCPKSQKTLDFYLQIPQIKSLRYRISRIYVPHFRTPPIVQKEDFCEKMENWAWEACQGPTRKVGLTAHVFFLNCFDLFDQPEFMDKIKWGGLCLPSDVVKFEIHRILQGFESYNDYFRMGEMSPVVMDPPAINMTHAAPSAHHITERLRQIGIQKIQEFFNQLVGEARSLGLIRDVLHVWDGQFHETWLQQNKPRKSSRSQFYGGTYNHGGAKVGVGVYEGTIMDWNGICTIPIHTDIFPANRNENPALREGVQNAYLKIQNPVPYFFLADKGPSGYDTQKMLWNIGTIPIIPVNDRTANGIRITKNKELRFYKEFTGDTQDETLERLYAIRPRIEEHYSLNDTVYRGAHLHCMGEVMTKIEILLLNCLGVLVPLTAYKIGRPDLMWSPTCFRSHIIQPERIFSSTFNELQKCRWDDEVVISPKRFTYEISAKKFAFYKRKKF